MKKETVGIEILITYRNGDRKLVETIRKTIGPVARTKMWNLVSQVR